MTTKQRAKQTLADLRPNAAIKCLQCDQTRPQAGSVKFHAHHVCEGCAAKLKAKDGGK